MQRQNGSEKKAKTNEAGNASVYSHENVDNIHRIQMRQEQSSLPLLLLLRCSHPVLLAPDKPLVLLGPIRDNNSSKSSISSRSSSSSAGASAVASRPFGPSRPLCCAPFQIAGTLGKHSSIINAKKENVTKCHAPAVHQTVALSLGVTLVATGVNLDSGVREGLLCNFNPRSYI